MPALFHPNPRSVLIVGFGAGVTAGIGPDTTASGTAHARPARIRDNFLMGRQLAVSAARVVKTQDEIECLKQASSIGDAAMWKIKYEWLKPGVREREIEAKVHEFMLERGCEIIYDIIVASGGNTRLGRLTDRAVEPRAR